MASPDFSQYVDLTVNDLQPTELYTAAADYARIALPEFEPRVGSVEDALLQAVSTVGALNLAAINRLPNGLMEGVLRLLGLERYEATASTVEVEFELLNAGSTVPANFAVVYEVVSNDQVLQYPFILQSAVTAAAGETTVAAELTCSVVGTIPTIPTGTELDLATTSSNVFSCTTTANVNQGVDGETEAEFLNRGTTYLASLSRVLSTARQIESYILATYPEVGRCKVYDLTFSASNLSQVGTAQTIIYDLTSIQSDITLINQSVGNPYSSAPVPQWYRYIYPPFYGIAETDGIVDPTTTAWVSGHEDGLPFAGWGSAEGDIASIFHTIQITGVDGSTVPNIDFIEFVFVGGMEKSTQAQFPVPGAFTVVLLGQNGLPVSRDVQYQIYQDVMSRVTAGLIGSVISAFPYEVDVTVSVVLNSGYSGVTVEAAVKEALESYYSMQNYPYWSDPISFNEIAAVASTVTGVKSVHEVTATAPAFGGDGLTPSVYANNDSIVSISTIGPTGNTYIDPALLGLLPQFTVTVNASSTIPD